MRIFSNFDTTYIHQALEEQLEIYKKKEIFVVRRSRYFFLFYVLPHFLGYLGLLLLLLGAGGYLYNNMYVYSLILILWIVVVWFRIGHKFLKCICDFTIITPGGITTYKQKGILNSVIKEIPSLRIKAIEIRRKTILSNIFGFGSIDIIADAHDSSISDQLGNNRESPGVLMLTYVNDPQDVKACISKICFK